MAKKQSKIKINLAEYDILFLVLAKLISAKPKMTLDQIKVSLLNEQAQGENFDDDLLTLKKAKWKHFMWSYEDRKSLTKDDPLQTVGGQLTCVAEAIGSIDHFIEKFGGDRLAGDFSFVNKKTKGTPVPNLPARKVAQKAAVTKTVLKKSAAKKSPAKAAEAKKSPAKKQAPIKSPAKKVAVKKTAAKKKTAKKK